MVSWDHVFTSIGQYFSTLRQEAAAGDLPPGHVTRGPIVKDITEQELAGLVTVCQLIGRVCEHVSLSH